MIHLIFPPGPVSVIQQARLLRFRGCFRGCSSGILIRSRCKPTQNALIESFNGKFRDECLNQNWFVDLRDAREVIDAWRVDHNTVHPHSSVRYLTPEEFAESVAARPASPSTPVVSIDPAWAGSDVQEPRSANL